MATRVVTGFWGSAWHDHGGPFSLTFFRHWPRDVEVMVYSDGTPALPPFWKLRDLAGIPGLVEFRRSYSERPAANGKGGSRDRWRAREKAAGYCWRFDAVKWAPQAFIPEAASLDMADGDLLVWLDGDVTTKAPVPAGWIEELLCGADLAYLGRARGHPEIGFLAFRLVPATRRILAEFADLYRSGRVFELPEWHSAFAFGAALASVPEARGRNLCPDNAIAHVWPNSPLAAFTDHHKGARKIALARTKF